MELACVMLRFGTRTCSDSTSLFFRFDVFFSWQSPVYAGQDGKGSEVVLSQASPTRKIHTGLPLDYKIQWLVEYFIKLRIQRFTYLTFSILSVCKVIMTWELALVRLFWETAIWIWVKSLNINTYRCVTDHALSGWSQLFSRYPMHNTIWVCGWIRISVSSVWPQPKLLQWQLTVAQELFGHASFAVGLLCDPGMVSWQQLNCWRSIVNICEPLFQAFQAKLTYNDRISSQFIMWQYVV